MAVDWSRKTIAMELSTLYFNSRMAKFLQAQTKSFSNTLDAWLSNLSKTGRSRKQAVSILVDSVLVVLALWGAFSLRKGGLFTDIQSTWHLYVLLTIGTVVIFMSLGIYRWVIRSSNQNLFRQLLKGSFLSALFLLIVAFLIPTNQPNPRSLFVIYGLLVTAGTCGVRFMWQELFALGKQGQPIAIYGTGAAGQQLLHALAQGSEYRAVLFLDDNQTMAGSTLSGIPVAHAQAVNIQDMLVGLEVERIVLALPKISAAEYHAKIDQLKSAQLPVLTIPTQSELVSGTASLNEVRDISIVDILGRGEVSPDQELLSRCVEGKVVLVTGGGGSIGSELSKQIIQLKPKKLIVFDQSEFNLYRVSEEIGEIIQTLGIDSDTFMPWLGSVTQYNAVLGLLKRESVNTVYHAAAYKHVPIIEQQPQQGVETNVFGTLNTVNAAIEANVDNFVLISTDKAVRPTNSMGATKRVAELILQAKSRQNINTKICMVRFGNVLGSSGSVVPKFKKQIEAGGPVTITHPHITRYFMTIPEAAQLVMQAGSIAVGGEVFVLDMGEPIRIKDLAANMIKLSGNKVKKAEGSGEGIEIQSIGLRPGEKMYEELFLSGDQRLTGVKKVYSAKESWIPWDTLRSELDELSRLCLSGEPRHIRSALLKLAFTGNSPSPSPSPSKIGFRDKQGKRNQQVAPQSV